ncbi:hypothetical protein BD560DRAFT_45243 [Blakeslea trispora]|nr:hypothetical protein BD560DRAFT_45243 [Blakeslea trispora]
MTSASFHSCLYIHADPFSFSFFFFLTYCYYCCFVFLSFPLSLTLPFLTFVPPSLSPLSIFLFSCFLAMFTFGWTLQLTVKRANFDMLPRFDLSLSLSLFFFFFFFFFSVFFFSFLFFRQCLMYAHICICIHMYAHTYFALTRPS